MINQSKISTVYIDWDHTLWDMEANASEALMDLFNQYDFKSYCEYEPETFVQSYKKHNQILWNQYENQLIQKDFLRVERFRLAMNDIGIPNELQPTQIWEDFLAICPEKKKLMPHAKELLESLSKKYPIVVITNGFEETQNRKIESSGLKDYFSQIIISETTRFKKPMKEIFEFAAKSVNSKTTDGIMIGDSYEADIIGAKNANMQAIHYIHKQHLEKKHIVTVNSLLEITNFI